MVAKARLRAHLSLADEITCETTDEVRFVDQGGNFERILCPFCNHELNVEDWWHSAMNKAYESKFRSLEVQTPCCRRQTSLNDLRYEWPAGFARFDLSARNPQVRSLPDHVQSELEQILKCSLRQIWAHI